MFCSNCGTQLPDGSRFCWKCGAQLGSAPVQPQVPQTPPSYGGAPVTPAVPPQKPKSKTGLIVAIVVVAVVVVVGLAVWGIVSLVGTQNSSQTVTEGSLGSAQMVPDGPHSSAQKVADGVDSAMDTIIDGDFSADATQRGMDDLVDLMPQEAVDHELAEQGMTRDDLRDEMSSALGDPDELSSVASLADIEFSATVGAPLDSDELADVNEELAEAGMSANVTDGNHISYSMEISALGQSDSQDMEESGLYAINIDGSWYLWGEGGLGL